MEENGNLATADADALATARRPDVDVVPTAPEESEIARSRRARRARRVTMTLVAAMVLAGLSGWLGVRSTTVSGRGGGYELTVTYAAVSRPGLSTPWSVEIRRAGGFDGPVTVSTTSRYFDAFDENGLDPDPSKATATAEKVIWEFEAPPGDVLTVSFDARIEPSAQWGREWAETSVLAEDGHPLATVRYSTWVMP